MTTFYHTGPRCGGFKKDGKLCKNFVEKYYQKCHLHLDQYIDNDEETDSDIEVVVKKEKKIRRIVDSDDDSDLEDWNMNLGTSKTDSYESDIEFNKSYDSDDSFIGTIRFDDNNNFLKSIPDITEISDSDNEPESKKYFTQCDNCLQINVYTEFQDKYKINQICKTCSQY